MSPNYRPHLWIMVQHCKQRLAIADRHGVQPGRLRRRRIVVQAHQGGQFRAHPDNLKEYLIRIVNREDPITRGIPDFKVKSEQYYMLVDPRNEVLAVTTHQSVSAPWTNGVDMPFVWKKVHGAGRVFYSACGHQCQEFTDFPEQLELTLRGMAWAAR